MTDELAATTPPDELSAHAWVANMIWANEELLKQRDQHRRRIIALEAELAPLKNHNANQLARQLADRTDELATLQRQFDDFRDTCSEHSADRCVEQARLDDAEAALVRYGNEMARLCEAAKAFRAERDDALAHLHRLVDHQDDECQFDHHGLCQAHPGKCGVVEARQFLAGFPDGDDA